MNPGILLAHPQPAALARLLTAENRDLCPVTTVRELLASLDQSPPDLVVLSSLLSRNNDDDLLDRIHQRRPQTPVLVVAPAGDDAAVASALRRGATDAVQWHPPATEFVARVERLLASVPLGDHGDHTHHVLGPDGIPRPLFHRSAAMKEAVGRLRRLAGARTTVLILGESGVGKELFARSIHYNSRRRNGPWVPLNCTAMPETMIESELFGHEKGAFTGAVSRTAGRFELAHKGTIFLDEIGDMSPSAQVKLLRVLEDRQVMRVGGSRPITVDVRLIAATNCDLEARVRQGTFRQDLYYRLNVVTVEVPSLARRGDDLPDLIDHFLEDAITGNGLPAKRLLPATRALLQGYAWPGNVRELKNLIESLVVTAAGEEITPDDLPAHVGRPGHNATTNAGLHAGLSMAAMQKELIRLTMMQVKGNRIRAAAMLGIGVRTLQRKLHAYHLTRVGRRGSG